MDLTTFKRIMARSRSNRTQSAARRAKCILNSPEGGGKRGLVLDPSELHSTNGLLLNTLIFSEKFNYQTPDNG
jgi:hypothetical protein